MSALATAPTGARAAQVRSAERVDWMRFLWVAPLTLIVAVAACFATKTLALTLDASLQRLPMLGPPMMTLAIEGGIAAIVVFAIFGLLVPRPIFWFRIVGVLALVLSWIPDIALAMGGTAMRSAMRFVGPLASLIDLGGGGPPAGGPPPGAQAGGPPPGAFAGLSIEQVLVLMLLHTVVALVCVVMLTTLARARKPIIRPLPSE